MTRSHRTVTESTDPTVDCRICDESHSAPESFCAAVFGELRAARTDKVDFSAAWPATAAMTRKAVVIAATAPRVPSAGLTRLPVRPAYTLSPRQASYAADLVAKIRRHDDALATRHAEDIAAGRVSRTTIDTLLADLRQVEKAAPAPQRQPLPAVAPGHYAIDTLDGAANEVGFYEVWHGRNGYIGLNREVGPSSVRVPWAQVPGILARIAADEIGALLRYGRETKSCGQCGRRLTNDESRALGIGPECRGKRGV